MKRYLWLPAATLSALFLLTTASFSQTTARVQAEKLFVEAQKALSRGENEEAESYLMKALQKDASFTSAIWQLAQIYEKRGKLEHARELLLRGLQQEPQAAWAREKLSQLERILIRNLLSEADSYMNSGEFNRAIPKLSLYLGIRPYDPIPLIRMGRCHLALGNLNLAKEFFIQALERDPSNSQVTSLLDEVDERIEKTSLDALISRAQTILADYSPEKREEAKSALEAILERDSGNSWAFEKLKELDLLSTTKNEKAELDQTSEEGFDAAKTIKESFSRLTDVILGNMLQILLAVTVILIVFDIRRRAKRKNYPLQGNLSLIPVLDVVSLLNSNLKSGRLLISAKNEKGEIFFEKGEIVHARWKSSNGKNAFHDLMELGSGQYWFSNHLPSVRHTISEPLSLLLLSMKSREESAPVKKHTPKREESFTIPSR